MSISIRGVVMLEQLLQREVVDVTGVIVNLNKDYSKDSSTTMWIDNSGANRSAIANEPYDRVSKLFNINKTVNRSFTLPVFGSVQPITYHMYFECYGTTDNGTYGAVLGNFGSGDPSILFVIDTTRALRFYYGSTTAYVTLSQSIPLNSPVFISAVINKTTNVLRWYVNGVFVNQATLTYAQKTFTKGWRIGNDYRTAPLATFNGGIGLVCLEENFYTDAQLTQRYNALSLQL